MPYLHISYEELVRSARRRAPASWVIYDLAKATVEGRISVTVLRNQGHLALPSITAEAAPPCALAVHTDSGRCYQPSWVTPGECEWVLVPTATPQPQPQCFAA